MAADEGTGTGSAGLGRTHCLLSWAVRLLAPDGTALHAVTVEIRALVLIWEARFPHTLASAAGWCGNLLFGRDNLGTGHVLPSVFTKQWLCVLR